MDKSNEKLKFWHEYNVVEKITNLNNNIQSYVSNCLSKDIINLLAIQIETNLKVKIRLWWVFGKLNLIFKKKIQNKELIFQIYKTIRSILNEKDNITNDIYELNNIIDSIVYYHNAYDNIDPMTWTFRDEKINKINYISKSENIIIEWNDSLKEINLDNFSEQKNNNEKIHSNEFMNTEENLLKYSQENNDINLGKIYVITKSLLGYIKDISFSQIAKKLYRKNAHSLVDNIDFFPLELTMLCSSREEKGHSTNYIRESLLFMIEFPFFFWDMDKIKNVFENWFSRKSYQWWGNYWIILKTSNSNDIDVVKKVSRANSKQINDFAKHKVFLTHLLEEKEKWKISKRIYIPDVFEFKDRLEFKWVRGKTLLRIEVEMELLKRWIMTEEEQINFTLISDQHLFHYFYLKDKDAIDEILDLNEEIDVFFAKGFQNMNIQKKRIEKILWNDDLKIFNEFVHSCIENWLVNIDFANPANMIKWNNWKIVLFDLDNWDILNSSKYYLLYKDIIKKHNNS